MDRKKKVCCCTYKITKKTQKQLKENGCCIAIKDLAVSKIKRQFGIDRFLFDSLSPLLCTYIFIYLYIYTVYQFPSGHRPF